MALTVKAVAELAGVSVRTLHHYDEIGLLKPAGQSAAGYRLYSQEDLERLQQILFFRELGFSLKEIRAILDSPGFDRRQALLADREALLQRKARIERLIATIDRTLAAMEKEDDRMLTRDEMKELFDGFDPAEYEEEVRRHWGGSREFEESIKRTRKYTKADWQKLSADSGEIYGNLARLMDRDPGDEEVQKWVGRWHQHINQWFYPCSLEVFRGLGEMYVEDERFTRNIDKWKPAWRGFCGTPCGFTATCGKGSKTRNAPTEKACSGGAFSVFEAYQLEYSPVATTIRSVRADCCSHRDNALLSLPSALFVSTVGHAAPLSCCRHYSVCSGLLWVNEGERRSSDPAWRPGLCQVYPGRKSPRWRKVDNEQRFG